MKAKYLLVALMMLTNVVALHSSADAQNKKQNKAVIIRNAMDSQRYTFTAYNASPMGGSIRQLTPPNTLVVLPDSIISNLPYFGRAYTAPVNPSDGGINFTSTDFEYVSKAKKDSWQITIKPKDARDAYQMTLTVFTNGNASLQVISNNRQAISFTGYVAKIKKGDR